MGKARFLLFSFLIAAFYLLKIPNAEAADQPAKLNCNAYAINTSIFNNKLHIGKWVQDAVTAILAGPILSTATGTNYKTNCECANAVKDKLPNAETASLAEIAQAMEGVEGDDCEKLIKLSSTGGLSMSANLAYQMKNTPRDVVNINRYARNILDNNLIYNSAHALVGFNAIMDAVLGAWIKIRDLAYVIFILIIVTLGFMIMFRKKVDPQTVVTIQNSLPNIVISFILITFSYPIAALIIPLSTPLSAYAGTLFGAPKQYLYAIGVALLTSNWVEAARRMVTGLTLAVFFPGVGIFLLILIALLTLPLIFALIYFVYTWIKVLARSVILVVFAPLILLLSALPGNGRVALNWFKNIVAVTLALPALWAVFNLSLFLLTNMNGIAGVLLGAVLFIILLFSAGKVPNAVNNFLGVEPLLPGGGDKNKK